MLCGRGSGKVSGGGSEKQDGGCHVEQIANNEGRRRVCGGLSRNLIGHCMYKCVRACACI